MNWGFLYTIAAGFIFGFTPILARSAYDGGANGVTMTFLRAVFSLPILAAVLRLQKIPIRVTRREMWDLFLACGCSGAPTTITLYASYAYISVGLATTLHFVYPITVSLACVVFYRERITPVTATALVAGTLGVALSAGGGAPGTGEAFGMALALFSGFAFTYYVIAVGKGRLAHMHYLKLTFWFCAFSALVSGIYGAAAGVLTFSLTPYAWFLAWVVSLFVSIFGVAFLHIGIKRIGAVAASILSTFEPITSVFFGVLVLGESLSSEKLAGGACILLGVVLIAWGNAGCGKKS